MATKAPKTVEEQAEDEASLLDDMADDANPPEYPEGTPELRPILAIRPRSRRAEFKARYADLVALQQKMTALRKITGPLGENADAENNVHADRAEAMYRLWSQSDLMYEIVTDLLVLAAVDPDVMAKWADEADDETLATAFAAYQHRAQPGEASSSTG